MRRALRYLLRWTTCEDNAVRAAENSKAESAAPVEAEARPGRDQVVGGPGEFVGCGSWTRTATRTAHSVDERQRSKQAAVLARSAGCGRSSKNYIRRKLILNEATIALWPS